MKHFALFLLSASLALAQATLSYTRQGSATVYTGSAVTLNVSLAGSGGNTIAAVQWSLATDTPVSAVFPASAPGNTLTGNTTACAGGTCILYNLKANAGNLADGVLATITLVIAPNATGPSPAATVNVSLTGPVAASSTGTSVPLAAGPTLAIPIAAAAPIPGVHILAGSSTDQYAVGGWAYPYPGTPTPYPTMRYGDFSYAIPLSPGNYQVSLTFIERIAAITAAGQHVFNVSINGQPVLVNFDIFALNGAGNPITKSFPVSLSGSTLSIGFQTVTRNAEVNAIDITPIAAPGSYTAVFANQTVVVVPGSLHGLGSALDVSCYDNGVPSHRVQPGDLAITQTNDVVIVFAQPQTGRCVINGAPGPAQAYPQTGLLALGCTTQRIISGRSGVGVNEYGDVLPMTPYTVNGQSCLVYSRRQPLGYVGESCCY